MSDLINKPVAQKVACWNLDGVWGRVRPRCPKLQKVLHCRNCEVFASAGRGMLDRSLPDGYIDEWSEIFYLEKKKLVTAKESVLVFRLGDEWIAIPTRFVKEITSMGEIHKIPHRDEYLVRGLANVRGELKICISLGSLLQLERGTNKQRSRSQGVYERIVVVIHKETEFVFPVSEVQGLVRYHQSQLENVPATITNAKAAFTTGVLLLEDEKHVACLDHDLLFEALDRRLL